MAFSAGHQSRPNFFLGFGIFDCFLYPFSFSRYLLSVSSKVTRRGWGEKGMGRECFGRVGMIVVCLSLARGLSPLLNFPDRLSVK